MIPHIDDPNFHQISRWINTSDFSLGDIEVAHGDYQLYHGFLLMVARCLPKDLQAEFAGAGRKRIRD